MLDLERMPVTKLKGVGAALATKLAKLGIASVQDLLFHLPMRYLDRTRVTPIGDLQPNTSVVIEGHILRSEIVFGRRRSLVCTLEDNSGLVRLRFYHFSGAQKDRLEPGTALRCFGEPRLGASGLELYHPEYEFVDAAQEAPLDDRLTPVYPLTEGLGQQRLRKLTRQAVDLLAQHGVTELLPPEVNARFGTRSLNEALTFIHFPPPDAPVAALMAGTHPAQQRLAFEELFAHHLAMQKARLAAQQEQAPVLTPDRQLNAKLLGSLGFELTKAQKRVIAEIYRDVSQATPMLRMVQGDVGSGKTLVAALAALAAAATGYQSAIVAPTEILAEQHRASFARWMEPLGFKVAWLAGKLGAAQKRTVLAGLADGSIDIAVGTHALFQETVQFANLGLAIIDEQHRFGVHQRLTLRQKGEGAGLVPHQLVMTATPIPRTLAMTAYADLDYSVIDELPPGRQAINTVLVSQDRRGEVMQRVRSACHAGQQAYWVCTLVEDSETLAASAAEQTAVELAENLPDVRIGLVHGRFKSKDKDAVMAAFKAGELDLLVATTVIEVGVDVPNATLMIIENPERLGLAQLHQVRGRVGRGTAASHCVLLYGNPLSNQAKDRLRVLRESNDGFVIAEKDLHLRGPGELLGTRQTGDMQYRLADLERDGHMLPLVQEVAAKLLHQEQSVNQLLARWFGANQAYAKV
jgi:ATP-dependent DNA helicase RecG